MTARSHTRQRKNAHKKAHKAAMRRAEKQRAAVALREGRS